MDYVLLVVGLIVGVLASWLLMRGKVALGESIGLKTGAVERASLAEKLNAATADITRITTSLTDAEGKVENLQAASADLREESSQTIATLNTTLKHERSECKEKLELLTAAREELTNQFKTLASEILEEKSKKFTELNKTNIAIILDPLKEKIKVFQEKVEDVYDKDTKDRTALKEQIKALTELNTTLSADAQNLTLALKGDSKAQGDYGELLLADVLERAGLLEGQHYDVQKAHHIDGGVSHVIPDVVVHLPGDRHIVVDSKFTLPDYHAFASASDKSDRDAALKRHLKATKDHIKGLSEKNYQSLFGLSSLDFVIMFVPLEPAFMIAVTNDAELFQYGWEKNVLLVSPSTLLFVIRTIANLWRQEDLSRNAQEISKRGAELYDKLAGFVNDLQTVGKRIEQAQESYDDARKKLSQGRGNVLWQAETLKELGVKHSKSLPSTWIDSDGERSKLTAADDSDTTGSMMSAGD
ncbi:MAG: DNA recombination protein RmuC [Planctomycetes bacterium]|nr:DNA recombination protein RmuC [Planctomycetota bacterium]